MGIEDGGKYQKKKGSRIPLKTETLSPAVQREMGWGKVMYVKPAKKV